MIFHARQERALARIEASLTQSDPALAAQFDRFNAVAARTPAVVRPRPRQLMRLRLLLALLVLSPVTVITAWLIIVSSTSQGSPGTCITDVRSCAPARMACRPPGVFVGPRTGDGLCGGHAAGSVLPPR